MLPNRDFTKHPACNWIPTGAKATCMYGIYSACLILEYLLSSTSLSYLSPSCCSSQVCCEGNWLPPPPSPKALEELSFSAWPLQSLQREALPNKATGGCIIQQRDSLRYEKKAAVRGGAFFFSPLELWDSPERVFSEHLARGSSLPVEWAEPPHCSHKNSAPRVKAGPVGSC